MRHTAGRPQARRAELPLRARGGRSTWYAAGAAALSLALVTGCADTTPPVSLSPLERRELYTRSTDLLLRAAQSDLGVASCNAIDALAKLAPRDGIPVFRQAIRSEIPLMRYAGYAAMGEVRDCDSLPALLAGVKDPNPLVRLAAAYAACRCGKTGYARLLVRALTQEPDPAVRAEAASLLGRLGEPRAEKALRAALRLVANEKARPVLLNIYGALAALGHRDAVQELVRYAQGDLETRTHALLLLADLGNPDTAEALRYRFMTRHEDYVETRLIAARGLGKLGYKDGFDLARRMLTFTDPNPNPNPENPDRTYPVRSMAIHALAEIGDPRAIPALREIAANSNDPRLQVAAAYAICRILNRTGE